jgi:hypothetical protein
MFVAGAPWFPADIAAMHLLVAGLWKFLRS